MNSKRNVNQCMQRDKRKEWSKTLRKKFAAHRTVHSCVPYTHLASEFSRENSASWTTTQTYESLGRGSVEVELRSLHFKKTLEVFIKHAQGQELARSQGIVQGGNTVGAKVWIEIWAKHEQRTMKQQSAKTINGTFMIRKTGNLEGHA